MTDGYDYWKAWEDAEIIERRKAAEANRKRFQEQVNTQTRWQRTGRELAQQFLKRFREDGVTFFSGLSELREKEVAIVCANAMILELWRFGLYARIESYYVYDDGVHYKITIERRMGQVVLNKI